MSISLDANCVCQAQETVLVFIVYTLVTVIILYLHHSNTGSEVIIPVHM